MILKCKCGTVVERHSRISNPACFNCKKERRTKAALEYNHTHKKISEPRLIIKAPKEKKGPVWSRFTDIPPSTMVFYPEGYVNKSKTLSIH